MSPADQAAPSRSGITLNDLFRRAARRRPGAIALADAPNRATFTDGPPLRLSYAEADRVVGAIAGRLGRMGLPAGAVIGIQMPNVAENILTVLGVLRAGMIAAPLPLLWRRADAVTALTRAGAKALITSCRAGSFALAHHATGVAADVFSIRYVCAFGADVPDGVVPFDDLFTAAIADPVLARDGDAADLAVVTFDVGKDGPVPVARRHLEMLAGGLCVFLESGIEQDANILTTLPPASFVGLCLTLVSWLLCGGTLNLHHPFDLDIFAQQRRDGRCRTLVLPAVAAFRLAETGLFAREGPTTILGAWHAPERLAGSADWRERDAVFIDVPFFGEAGLVAARRTDGRPMPLPFGLVRSPRDGEGAVAVAELLATDKRTLALRGPMVPRQPFPPGIERTDQPHFEIGPGGAVDTGYGCHSDPLAKTTIVTGPPAGIVTVGAYRFSLCALLETIGSVDAGATFAALPDATLGERFAGNATDSAAMRVCLDAMGLNPLVAAAFGRRRDIIPEPIRAAG